MKVATLQQHITTLATLEETGAPVISCYLSTENGPLSYWEEMEQRVQVLRKSFGEPRRGLFEAALEPIYEYLAAARAVNTSGLAIFSRAGNAPFFLPLEFRVPLPTWISVNSTPNIYHLVEIKDNYDRYVILLSTEENARILGINLGSVTEDIWRNRPDLRRRVGHEWTREHFQDHRRERTRQFIREQIRIAERLMNSGGYSRLILAGSPRIVAGIRQALPKHMAARLVDVVSAKPGDRLSDVVAATLQSFLEYEETESVAMVDKLLQRIYTHGLAVAGPEPSLAALKAGQADVLVLAKDYDSEDREEMVRLAERAGCWVEVVDHSDALMQLGGVGCLLRYARRENGWRQEEEEEDRGAELMDAQSAA